MHDISPVFCAISPESGRMDVQARLHRQVDIQRATDSERVCRELPEKSPESGRMDVQARLHRQVDIRRATDSERVCRELPEKSPEGGRMDVQASLHRQADIRWATDRERKRWIAMSLNIMTWAARRWYSVQDINVL